MTDEKKKRRRVTEVRIDRKICKACGLCAGFCPSGALTVDEYGYAVVADLSKCNGCDLCMYRCPDFGVEVIKEGSSASAEAKHGD